MNTEIAAPVFQVADVDAAMKHHKDVHGFMENFRVGDYAGVKRKGAKVNYPLQDSPYGMREFMVSDLDGHHLAFGREMKQLNKSPPAMGACNALWSWFSWFVGLVGSYRWFVKRQAKP